MRLKIELAVLAILIIAISTLFFSWKHERSERIRTEGNQTALLDSITHYQTKSGLNAASVGVLNLKVKELKQFRSEDARAIEDLNLKLKRVQLINKTATSTKTKVKTVFKDRIIQVPVPGTDKIRIDTLRCMNYIDPYLTIDGCLNQLDEFTGLVESRDTLTQVIHRIPKKIWFIKFGTKAIRQEVFSKNPNTNIDFAEIIELKKRRRK